MNDLLWVAGGRDYDDRLTMDQECQMYLNASFRLITGAAKGADLLAESIWKEYQLPYVGVPSQWDLYGKAAGPRRNHDIAANWEPTIAVFFPGGKGTAHALSMAKKLGIPYREAG